MTSHIQVNLTVVKDFVFSPHYQPDPNCFDWCKEQVNQIQAHINATGFFLLIIGLFCLSMGMTCYRFPSFLNSAGITDEMMIRMSMVFFYVSFYFQIAFFVWYLYLQ